MSSDTSALEKLPRDVCLSLIAGVPIGRAIFTLGALPAIVPVTFAVQDGAILFCTGRETRLADAADGEVLAFEVDDFGPATSSGWSVIVTGVAEIVTDPDERARAARVVVPWAPGDRDVYIRLPFTVVSGRRLGATHSAPPPPSDLASQRAGSSQPAGAQLA